MNKQVMEKWVAALRSGKYRKGRNNAENPGALKPETCFYAWNEKNEIILESFKRMANTIEKNWERL